MSDENKAPPGLAQHPELAEALGFDSVTKSEQPRFHVSSDLRAPPPSNAYYIGEWPTRADDGSYPLHSKHHDLTRSKLAAVEAGLQLAKLSGAFEALCFNRGAFPWSSIQSKDLTTLIKTDPEFLDALYFDVLRMVNYDGSIYFEQLKMLSRAFCLKVPTKPDMITWRVFQQTLQASLDSARAINRWVRGKRRLVTITEKSASKLLELPVDFNRLIPPYEGEKPWKRGHMFHIRHLHTLVYIECQRTLLGNEVYVWMWDDLASRLLEDLNAPPDQRTPSLDDSHLTASRKALLNAGWAPIVVRQHSQGNIPTLNLPFQMREWWAMSDEHNAQSQAEGFPKLGISANNGQERLDYESRLIIAINALSAMLAVPDVIKVITPKRKGKKGNRRKSSAGGVRGTTRLTLSEDATRMAVRRMFVDDRERNEREKSTRTVGKHHVDQHEWRVWVNKPNGGEHILATRQKQNRKGDWYTQYRVKRMRGPKNGFSRGSGPLAVNRKTVVTGIDDA